MAKTLYLNGFLIFALLSFFLYGCAQNPPDPGRPIHQPLPGETPTITKSLVSPHKYAELYNNSPKSTQGALIGGAAGAATGYLSGVGIIPGSAIGAIMGGSIGSYLDHIAKKQSILKRGGVTAIVLGDQVLIVIPSFRVFCPLSANIRQDAYNTLKAVACYINRFVKMTIKISAYTDDIGSAHVNNVLSQQQAEAIASFLLASGMNTRLLYTEGCGSSYWVVPQSPQWEGNCNYRIEITFEKICV